jgi:hypothetical protein
MFLADNSVTLLDSSSPLFSTLAPSAEETCGKVQDPVVEISAATSRTTQQHHEQLSLHQVLRSAISVMESITMGDMGANKIKIYSIYNNFACQLWLYVYIRYHTLLVVQC